MSEQSRKQSLLHCDAGDKGGASVCLCICVCVCYQVGGTGFSGRTCSSMLVFVRGSQIPGRDWRKEMVGWRWGVAQILVLISKHK